MPGVYSSDSDDNIGASHGAKLFGRERPIHHVLGGGKGKSVCYVRYDQSSFI